MGLPACGSEFSLGWCLLVEGLVGGTGEWLAVAGADLHGAKPL